MIFFDLAAAIVNLLKRQVKFSHTGTEMEIRLWAKKDKTR